MLGGYFLILLSATGFGLMPILALFAYKTGMSVATLLFLRFAVAALFFLCYSYLKIKEWKISRRQVAALFLLGGVLYSLQSSFYFSSVKFISASLAALLLYLYPVIVTALSFFINREPISKSIIGSTLVSIFGMVLVLGAPTGEINLYGVLLAIGAAVTYSVYIILGNRVTTQVPPLLTSCFISIFAAFSFLVSGWATNSLHFDFKPIGWLLVAGVAIFSTVMSIFSFFAGMTRTGPTKASILSMVEPVITSVFSFILLSDELTRIQLIGGAIVLAGAVFVVVSKVQLRKQDGSKFHT